MRPSTLALAALLVALRAAHAGANFALRISSANCSRDAEELRAPTVAHVVSQLLAAARRSDAPRAELHFAGPLVRAAPRFLLLAAARVYQGRARFAAHEGLTLLFDDGSSLFFADCLRTRAAQTRDAPSCVGFAAEIRVGTVCEISLLLAAVPRTGAALLARPATLAPAIFSFAIFSPTLDSLSRELRDSENFEHQLPSALARRLQQLVATAESHCNLCYFAAIAAVLGSQRPCLVAAALVTDMLQLFGPKLCAGVPLMQAAQDVSFTLAATYSVLDAQPPFFATWDPSPRERFESALRRALREKGPLIALVPARDLSRLCGASAAPFTAAHELTAADIFHAIVLLGFESQPNS